MTDRYRYRPREVDAAQMANGNWLVEDGVRCEPLRPDQFHALFEPVPEASARLEHPNPVLCEHANECPPICPCDPECYCKSNTCRDKSPYLHTRGVKMSEPITDHHDGHGLNESITIKPLDEVGPGGAHHRYACFIKVKNVGKGAVVTNPVGDEAIKVAPDGEFEIKVADIQFQTGPRNEAGSTPGVTHMALLALLIDPLRAFQVGPFASRETGEALHHLEEALHWFHARARERAKRGVLGKAAK